MNFLKKYLLSLALFSGLLFWAPAMDAAVDPYGIYSDGSQGAFNVNGSNKDSSFTAAKDASLTFTVEQNVKTGSVTGASSSSPITMGVFTYTKENGQIVVKESAIFTGLQVGDVVNTGDALSINAGDMVGMYVQRDGKTAFLTDGSGAAYGEGYLPSSNVQHGRYEPTTSGIWPFEKEVGYGEARFEMDNALWQIIPYNVDIVIRVEGDFPAPTLGAPLPGVLATVALTTLAGGYLNRRRKPVSVETEE